MYKIPINNTFSIVCSVNIKTSFSRGGYEYSSDIFFFPYSFNPKQSFEEGN